jgi:hypothetical protein
MGSLRLQDIYRIDPNDLRPLPTGVAHIVTAGRAAQVSVTRSVTSESLHDTEDEGFLPVPQAWPAADHVNASGGGNKPTDARRPSPRARGI